MKLSSQRWLYLILSTVMMLFIGIIYAWSILKEPLQQELGWSQGALGLNYTITMSCFCLGGILAGVLIRKTSHRTLLLLSAILAGAGFYIASLAEASILVLYLAYGGLCGLGIGMVYNIIISVITAWFPERRSTVTGIMMMAYGASALLLGGLAGAIMTQIGWRSLYRLLAVGLFLSIALCALIVKKREESETLPENGAEHESLMQYSAPQMLRTSNFWRFYAMTILFAALGSCVISMAKDIALSVGAISTLAVLLTGVLSVCNGLGRVSCGVILDRFGWQKTIPIVGLLALLAITSLLAATMTKSLLLLMVGILATGLSYGFMPPLSSAYVAAVYGTRHFSLNFSIANTMLIFSSAFAAIGGSMVTYFGGFRPLFILLFASIILGNFFGLSLIRKRKAKASEQHTGI